MRIGFLSHSDMSLHFFRAPIMRELKKRGHEVFAIAPNGTYTDALAREFNAVTYELDKASINPFTVMKNSDALVNLLKSLNLDMLQTSAHKSNVFGTFAAKKAGVPKVLNLVEGLGSFYIDTDLKSKAVKFVIEKLYKRAFAMSDGCIFVNDADPDYFLSQNLIAKDKVIRIKSVGVNASIFDKNLYKSADLGEKIEGKKVILMMGRALWHKGIGEFYEASKILKERKDVRFVFVGDTFEGNKSSAGKEFLRDENVLWAGWRDNVCELYKSAYMFVLPSYKEGFPRTILEAMSMELPCVVSDVSGCVEAVQNGENGLICKQKNASDLAEKIATLLDDESLARKMGQNGRELVLKNYDEPVITQKYMQVYRKFLDV